MFQGIVEGSVYDFKDDDIAVLFKKLVHRFANMMSAETVRKFKRAYQLKKSSALRQGLQGKSNKKAKRIEGMPTVSSIIAEALPKTASHFSLKAFAFKGDDEIFVIMSAIDIKFVMMGYSLQPTRENKKTMSKKLVEALKLSEVMPEPAKLSQQAYDSLKTPVARPVTMESHQTDELNNAISVTPTIARGRGIK